MKKLLFVCFCLMAASLQAQTWWGYWNTSMPREESTEALSGTTHCAIRITPDNALLIDGRIHGVRFWLSDKSVVTEASIWASVRQFSDSGEPDMAVKTIMTDELKDLTHDGEPTVVMFDEPVDVLPASNRYATAYVGFTIKTSAASRLITAGRDTRTSANSCFINWQNREAYEGPLALQLMVSGKRIGVNSATASPIEEQILTTGASTTIDLKLKSEGTAAINSVDYEVRLDGVKQAERHTELSQAVEELDMPFVVPVDVALPDDPRSYDCEIRVVRVNNEENENVQPAGSGLLVALSRMPLKRTVMEELTGTWCPNCPRGDVGLHLLDSIYGNRFVGISVHNGDPMTLEAYDRSEAKRRFVDGYPSAAIDRTIACDPYQGLNMYVKAFQTDRLVDYALAVPTVADLSVTASWDETMTTIAADVATTFRYNAPTAPYTLALTVTADSLTGDGDSWLQVNTYVGSTEWDSYMDVFTKGERRMRMSYDHVPVYVDGIDNGIDGSITLPLVADATQHYRRTIALDDIPLKDILTPLSREHLHVVALLLDPSTGLVVNAAKGHVATDAGASVGTVPTAAPLPHRLFTPDGRPAAPTHRGLVIEQRNDGRRKVVIK